ncbi:hypothetical protein M378DRAFT_166189, partial [Amanita muscaria Koide BX008]
MDFEGVKKESKNDREGKKQKRKVVDGQLRAKRQEMDKRKVRLLCLSYKVPSQDSYLILLGQS